MRLITFIALLVVSIALLRAENPVGWTPVGTARHAWEHGIGIDGSACVVVKDAHEAFAGWLQRFPVRGDCAYALAAEVKTEGLASPERGRGAAIRLTFFNRSGQALGQSVFSEYLSGTQLWRALRLPATTVPTGAVYAEVTLGMTPGRGTACFDNARLEVKQVGGEIQSLIAAPGIGKWLGGDPRAEVPALPQFLRQNAWRLFKTPKAGTDGVGGIRLEYDSDRLRDVTVAWANTGLSSAPAPVVEGFAYEATWRLRIRRTVEGIDPHGPYYHFDTNSGGATFRPSVYRPDDQWHDYTVRFEVPRGGMDALASLGIGSGPGKSEQRTGRSITTLDVGGYTLLPVVEIQLKGGDFEASADRPEIVITPKQVKELFGDRPARMLIHYPGASCPSKTGKAGPIFCVDLQADPPQPYMVVEHAVGGLVADPFLSPDGTRVVFGSYPYATDGTMPTPPLEQGLYVATVKPRQAGSAAHRAERTRIAEKGFDPRWWAHPATGDEYILYVDTVMSTSDDIAGTTYLQKLKRGTCQPEGAPRVLIKGYAFRGGRSPDGRFICTTLPGYTLAELKPHAVEDALARIVFSEQRVCNGSISTDPRCPDHFLWINHQHTTISIRGLEGDITPRPGNAPGYSFVQWCEWATDGDFLTASPTHRNDDANPVLHDAWIYQFSTRRWVQVSRRAYTTHLWVDGASATPGTPTTPVTTATTTPTPPAAAPAYLFAWRNGNASLRAHAADGKPLFTTFAHPTRHGAALFDRHYALRLDEGAFSEPRVAQALTEAIRASGQLALVALIANQGGTGPIFSLASERDSNFALIAKAGSLSLRWKHGAQLTELPLGIRLTAQPLHLAITIRDGALRVYQNGKPVLNQPIAWDPARWTPLPLVLGQLPPAPGTWRGTLEGIILHHQTFSEAVIAAMATENLAVIARRIQTAPLRVKVRLIQQSDIPAPAETVYPRSYAIAAYDVLEVLEGRFTGKTIRIGRWTEMDNTRLGAALARKGDVETLQIEPLDAHPELEKEEVFDTLEIDPDTPVYFDIGPLRFAR
ncbi:MAG: hypothetical protein BWY76_00405 [bacterium ADurb.Bin429]|nr:MAG: hypothetical protein BWY76_00405 [bacterium ADurb.Bin429]